MHRSNKMLYSFAVCSDNKKEGYLERNIQSREASYPLPPYQKNLRWEVVVKIGLGEGWVGSLPESYSDPLDLLEVLVLSPILTTGRKIFFFFY